MVHSAELCRRPPRFGHLIQLDVDNHVRENQRLRFFVKENELFELKRIGFSVVSQTLAAEHGLPLVCRRTVKIRSKLEAMGGFLLMKPSGISPSCACLADWR